jgi:hypothetical protein
MMKLNLNGKTIQRAVAAIGLTAVLSLSGCSADFGNVTATAGPVPTTGSGDSGPITGLVHGGQQPITNATVQLWEVGTSVMGSAGYGSAATPLGSSVKTMSDGSFTFGSANPAAGCATGAYVYITAAGGDPQISSGAQPTGNPAIALMAAIGPCSGLSSSTYIQINEVTTVAAAFAMAQFGSYTAGSTLSAGATAQTPVDTFGTSSSNVQGIANAMGVAQILASTATGLSPGSNRTGNVSNIEYWQVNTLADILALCVNSTGAASSPCSPIITAATVGTTAPADTIQIALNLAKNPTLGTAAQGDINNTAYNAITGTPPFQPYDSAAPNDWTIGYSIPTGTSNTRWLAIDGFGNAWVATGGATAYELSPTGDIIDSPTSYTVVGAGSATNIANAYQVAVDTANNAWFVDNSNQVIFEVTGSTAAGIGSGGTTSSPTGNNATGTALSTSGVASTGLEGIAIDGVNNVWATISSKEVVGVLSGATTLTSTGTVALTGSPFGIAIDLSNQPTSPNYTNSGGQSFIYALDSGGCATGTKVNGNTGTGTVGGSIAMAFTGATTIGANSYTAGQATPLNYIVDSSCNNVTNVPVSTTIVANGSATATGNHVFMSVPYGIAIDNSNEVWVVNQNYNQVAADSTATDKFSLSKLTAPNYSANFTGATVGPTLGFTTILGGGLASPFYLAMDGASGAWVGNSTTPTGGDSAATGGISGFTNSGVAITPALGFFGGYNGATARKFNSPRGVAVDGSGNVWVTNTGSGADYVTVIVGIATPTVTPLATGIKNGTLASLP